MGGHRTDFKRGRPVTSLEITQYDDCKIVLVEDYPCNSRYELYARERYWIENTPNCVNKNLPTRNINEWRDLHKDEIKCKCKEYYLNNTDKVKNKRMEYYKNTKQQVECECGSIVLNCNLEKHKQTEKHKKAMTDYVSPE